MYNIKILNEAVSSIIELADNVSDDRRERSSIYHLLKLIRGAVRDFPQNTDDNTTDLINAYAAKIKRYTNGKISRIAIVKRHDDNEVGEIIPMPITNAHDAIIHLIRQNLRVRNRENYSAIHKIADLYMHRFFEYSEYVDKHPDIEDWEFKQTLLTAFCSELGLHIGWLEKAMRFEEIPYDDIIV